MSSDTSEATIVKEKQVTYQSITFSDDDDDPDTGDQPSLNPENSLATEDPTPYVGSTEQEESQPKEGGNNLYSSLKEIDVLCGQVTSEDNEGLPEGTDLEGHTDFLREEPGDEQKDNSVSHSFEETGEVVANEIATYTCKLCSLSFNEQSVVENHLMVEHDLGEQTALFRVISKVKRKKKNRSWRKEKDGYFHCRFCHHRSRRSINVRDHEQQKHANEEVPDKTYLCKLCNQRFELNEIFGHVQTEHPSEADSSNFVGNSLSEHYTLSFTAEKTPEKESPEIDGSPNSFNYCQYCSYKSKSLRGLRLHERMQHSKTANIKKGLTCMTCGEKRTANSIHTCHKSKTPGRKQSLMRNSDGHLMCANCPYTAKQYQSLYVHIKARNHQAARLHPVLPPSDNLLQGEEIQENDEDGPSRGLRKRKDSKTTQVVVEKDIAEDQVLAMDTDKEKDPEEVGQGEIENPETVKEGEEWALALDALNDSDTQDSAQDDSDKDPDWGPNGNKSPIKGRQAKQADESDSEEEFDENGKRSRKRKASHEDGSKEKRRKSIDIPKDPNSPPPIKLSSGIFKCNFCDYESKYQRSVETHQWRHTDFKPLKCDQCKRSFRQSVQLEKHKCTGFVEEGTENLNELSSKELDKQPPAMMSSELASREPITIEDDPPPSSRADVHDISPAPENGGMSTNAEIIQSKDNPISEAPEPAQAPTPPTNTSDKSQEETLPERTPVAANQSGNGVNATDKYSSDKTSPQVTSPTPIVIAPPMDSRHLEAGNNMSRMGNSMMTPNGNGGGNPFNTGNPQVINLDPEQDPITQVSNPMGGCNLANNPSQQDMIQMNDPNNHLMPPTPPHSNPPPVRMTSPVGTPLNITPIPSNVGMGPNPPMSMNAMPHGMEGVMPGDYGMQGPPGLMNNMPHMLGPGNPMPTNYPNFQGGDPSGMNHHLNQMSNFMGNMGGPMGNMGQHPLDSMGHPMGNMGQPLDNMGQPIPPQFPAPDSNLLQHLNITPNNEVNLMPNNSGPVTPNDPNMPQMNNQMQFSGAAMSVNPSESMGNTNSFNSTSQNQNGSFNLSQTEPSNSTAGLEDNVNPLTDSNGETGVFSSMTLPTIVEGSAPSGSPSTSRPSSSSEAPPSSAGVGESTGGTESERPESNRSSPTVQNSLTEQSGTSEQSPSQSTNETANTETTSPATDSAETSAAATSSSTTDPTASVTANAVSILESIASAPIPMETEPIASSADKPVETPLTSSEQESATTDTNTNTMTTTDPLTLTEVSMASVVSDLTSASQGVVISDDVVVTPVSLVISSVAGNADTVVATASTGATPSTAPQPAATTTAAAASRPDTNESGKSINDLFKCMLCRVYFEDQQMYRSHMLHHGSTIGTCRQCSRMFRTPLLFMNHLHCPINCKGLTVNSPVTPYAVTPTRGRGRGRGSTATTRMAQPQTVYPQMQSVRGRGGAMRANVSNINLATGQAMTSMTMAVNRGGRGMQQQGMRQIAPTSGRRGRPPLSSRPYTSANMIRQQMPYSAQLQQHNMALQQQQQLQPPRAQAPVARQGPPQGRRQRPPPISEDVIVID